MSFLSVFSFKTHEGEERQHRRKKECTKGEMLTEEGQNEMRKLNERPRRF